MYQDPANILHLKRMGTHHMGKLIIILNIKLDSEVESDNLGLKTKFQDQETISKKELSDMKDKVIQCYQGEVISSLGQERMLLALEVISIESKSPKVVFGNIYSIHLITKK